MNKLLFLLPILFLLSSCGSAKYERICHDGNSERDCTKEEITMIDGMHSIIKSIENFDKSHINKSFSSRGEYSSIQRARILLFGENHTDVIGQIETFGALNALLRSGDALLLEGGDRHSPRLKNCALSLIYSIYRAWALEKEGKSYAPGGDIDYKNNLIKILVSTRKSYDFGGLNFNDITCKFWDDEDALDNSIARLQQNMGLTRKSLKIRNESMVEAIKENLTKYRKVAVNTGYRHMPMGDLILSMKENDKNIGFPKDFKDLGEFYRVTKRDRRLPEAEREFVVDDRTGASKVIYYYLKDSQHTYVEMIHNHILNI